MSESQTPANEALQRLLAELEVTKAQLQQTKDQLQQRKEQLHKAKIKTPKHLFDGKGIWNDHMFRNDQEARLAGNILMDDKRRGDFFLASLTGTAATLARQLRENEALPERYVDIIKVLEPAYLKTGETE